MTDGKDSPPTPPGPAPSDDVPNPAVPVPAPEPVPPVAAPERVPLAPAPPGPAPTPTVPPSAAAPAPAPAPAKAAPSPAASPAVVAAAPTPAAPAPAPAPAKAAPAPASPPAVVVAEPPSAEPSAFTRRVFLWSLPVGWTAFAAAVTASLIASGRSLFPNVLFEPPQSFKAGFPSEYNVGEVDIRYKDSFSVWIVREPEGFYALIAVCTHLGCSPNWLPTENKFKCPCHGSGFYRTGVNFEGPAPRPLERARIVLADDGQLLVDKSVKFQQEKGEWENAEAFLKA